MRVVGLLISTLIYTYFYYVDLSGYDGEDLGPVARIIQSAPIYTFEELNPINYYQEFDIHLRYAAFTSHGFT